MDNFIKGMNMIYLYAKSQNLHCDLYAEHDVIYISVDPKLASTEFVYILNKLGFVISEDAEGWEYYV